MRIVLAAILCAIASTSGAVARQGVRDDLEFIDTSFENASPVWYERDADGSIQIHLLYDHERASPNRAAGHIHLRLHGRPGAKLTLEFRNLENVYNGAPGSVAGELKAVVISANGRDWKSVATESLPQNRVRLTVVMPGPHAVRRAARTIPVVRPRSDARVDSPSPARADHEHREDGR